MPTEAAEEFGLDAPSTAADDEVSIATTLSFGAPVVGLSGPFFFIQFYLLNFSTDDLLITPATIAAIIAACRVWDAVSDPMVGFLSDRTNTRFGRRRPRMLICN